MTAATRSLTNSRALRDLIDDAQRRGWAVSKTGGSHLKFTHPRGGLVYASSTPRNEGYAASRTIARMHNQEKRFANSKR